MAAPKQFRQAELELAAALTDRDPKLEGRTYSADCPSAEELGRFIAGKHSRPEAILAHLGTCARCAQLLGPRRVRRVTTQRLALAFASIAAIALLGWLVLVRPARVPSGVSIIDLRPLAATRGVDSPAEAAASVLRKNGTTRIVLPIGSEGSYTCEVLEVNRSPLAETAGNTSLEDDKVALDLPIDLGKLKSGRYILMLQRDGTERTYYNLDLK
jgi:hypothetical protein